MIRKGVGLWGGTDRDFRSGCLEVQDKGNWISIKAQWNNHPIEEATWKIKKNMWDKYPQLFENTGTLFFLIQPIFLV